MIHCLINKYLYIKAIRIALSISILFSLNVKGQAPTWVAGTPSIPTTAPLSITCNYGINTTGRVYIAVLGNFSATDFVGTTIKNVVQSGGGGAWVAVVNLPVSAGNVGLVLQSIIDVPAANKLYTVYFVAESSSGTLQAWSTRLYATTLPCPPINILTGFTQPVICINKIPVAVFETVILNPDPNVNGILKGTQWTLDWGDGTTAVYTSTADNDLPPLALRTHTYSTVTDCNYVFTNGIRNPCGQTRAVQYVAVVHGRDIPLDGDGVLELVDNATGNTVINVCAGTQSIITIRDNSTWNCQNPVLPGGLTPEPNLDPRNIEWLYGRDPGGAIRNTITGAVNIATLGNAPRASGRFSPIPYGPTSLSQSITIPASCLAGQYFRVYLKNWNKCNWTDPEYINTYVDINVIAAPPAPTVPTKTICFGGDRTLTVTSPAVGTLTWYSDAGLTTVVGTGSTYVPAQTAVGSYNFWVTDQSTTGLLCMSPVIMTTLTINPIPNTPTISRNNPDFCFDGSSSIILTANPLSPPAVSSYQWYRNTVAVVGATNSTITLSTVAQSGDYTCRTFGIAPTNCPSLLSNQITVNIWALATVTAQPGNPTVCQGSNTAFSITAGGAASNIRWQRRIGAGAWVDITAGTTPNDGCTYSNYTTNTLTITSAAAGMNAYQYRARLTTTTGSCITYSNAGTLTVNPTANITTQPSNATVCELSNTSFSVVASVAGPSTITGYQWQRRPGAGGYTNITGPATPNDGCTYGGYTTAALTITTAAAGMNNYTYRVVITTTGGCTITSTARTLTVNQLADITAHPANSAICAGTNTTFSVTNDGTPAVTAHQWQRRIGAGAWVDITAGTTPNDGCTYSNWTTGTLGLAGVPAGMNTHTYRCILTTAGGCTISSNTGLLTVHTIPIDRVVTAADYWLCYNTGTNINLAASENGIVYQLRTGVVDVGASQLGNGANRAFPTGNLTATSIFNINAAKTTTIGASTLTCYRQMTNTPTVNVNSDLTITNHTHPDVCLDGTTDLPSATPAGGSTNYTYAWTGTGGYTNTIQNPAPFTPASGTGAYSYTITVTDEGFRTASADNTICTVADPIPFTVNPLPAIGMNVTDPVICNGQTATITLNGSIAGTRYQLRLDADDSNVGAPVNGTGGNINFNVTPVTTTVYNVLATIVATGCDEEVTNKSTVTVNPLPTPLISGLNNVCSGATLVGYSTPLVGANTYVWNISGGVISGGAGTNAITVTWGVAGAGWVRVTETMAVTGCQATTANYIVTINPGAPASAPALTSGATEICKDGTLNINVSDVATASTYEWDYSWVPGVSNAITATSDNSINLLGLGAGTYTVAVRGVNGCGPGPWMPVHSFDINDIPYLSPLGGTLCSDVASGITLAITNFNATYCSGITYNITAINNGGLTASAGAPATGTGLAANVLADDAWTNRTAANVNVVYTIVPVSVQGCTGNPENITLTVSPEPDLNNLSLTVCSDATTGVTLTDVHSLANSFEIVSITPQAGLGTTAGNATTGAGKAANAIFNDRWTNKTVGLLMVTYAIIPRIAGGCIGDQENVDVTISPEPDLNDLNKTICSGEITGITLSDVHSLANSFEIVSIIPQAGLVTTAGNATTGAGKAANAIVNDRWTNKTAGLLTITYAIIPRIAGGCIGDQENVVVTINPEPDLSPLSSTVCSDEITGIIFSDIHGIAISYEIVSITQQAGLVSIAGNATTGTGKAANAIQNDKWTNKTPGSRIVTYVVRPRIAVGCIGDQEDVLVTVNPEPDLSALNTTVCSDFTTGVTLTDVHSLANSFEILSITPQAGLVTTAGNATTGAGKAANAIVNDRWTNKTAGLLTVTYAIIPRIAAGCIGDQENVVVSINPEPDLSPLNSTVCSDAVTGITLSDVHGIANSFEIMSITPQAGLVAGGSNSTTGAGKLASAILNDIWTNKTAAALTVTFAIIPRIGAGCTGDQENVVVTVNPEPDLSPLSSTVCSDAVTGITFSDVLGLANSFEIVSITPTGGINGAAGNATTGSGKLAGAIANDTWTNKTAINQTVTYVIVPRINAGCIGDPENVIVTVRPEPDLNNLNTTICSDEPTGVTLADVHSLASSFEIVSIVPQAGLLPAAGNATSGPGKAANAILNDRFTNKTAGALTVTYAVMPRIAAGCIGDQENVVITINPEPDLADLNKTICSDIITGITLSDVHGIANRFNIISIIPGAGLVAGATNASAGADQLSNAIFNDKWTNSTSGPLTVTYRVIPRISGGCSGDQEDIVVTVSPEPDLSDLNTIICNDVATGVILSDVAGLANRFNIISITADPGLTAAAGNATTGNDKLANSIATDVWTNSTTGSLTVTYVIVPSISGICLGDPENVVITIRPPIRGGNITGGAPVCYNTDAPGILNMVLASGGDGAIVYSWYYNENLAAAPNDPGWILIAGATGSDYDPGALINPTKFIRRAIDGSCTATASTNMVTFTIKPLPVTSAITGEIKLCDDAVNRIYQVVNSAGSTYDWSVPAGLLDITFDDDLFFIMVDAVDDASGTGPVQVIETSSLGCLGAPVTLNVTVAPVLPGEDITGPAVVCQGAVDVSFSIPDRAGSTYSWVVPAGASISNDPGSHEIFVSFTLANPLTSISVVETTAGGCTTVHNPMTITVSPLPATYNVTAPSYFCFGAGGVTVTLSNSQAGVNYQLLKNAVPEGVIVAGNGSPLTWNGMTAGMYTVRATFTAAPFCSILMNGNPSVEENLPLIINDIIITEPTCFGASNGSIVIDASGGYPPATSLMYSINGGTTFQSSATFTGIGQGTYNIVVRDSRNCTAVAPPEVVTQPVVLGVSSIVVTNAITCFGFADGSVRVTATGGTGSYAYQWYTDVALTIPLAGQTNDEATGLPAGTYWVKVTDLNGCFVSASITLIQPAQLTATAVVTSNYNGSQISCNGSSDAVIEVSAMGGTGIKSYYLNEMPLNITGAGSGVFTGVGPGSYTVQVTDLNVCETTTAVVTVTEPAQVTATAAITSNYNGSHISCNGASDGRITVTASGGTGSRSYVLNEIPGNTTGAASGIFTGVGPGTYTVRVRDANLCEIITAAVTVTEPSAVTVSALVTSDYNGSELSCAGSSDGILTATSAGGTGIRTYQVVERPANVTGALTGVFTGLPAGTYTVKVTDVNGCNITSAPVTIDAPAIIIASALVTSNYNGSRISCFGASDGQITVTASGGTGALTYVLNQDPLNVTGAVTGVFTGLQAGVYSVTVTDENNCTRITANVTINNPLAITASAAVTSNYSGAQVSCSGASDGIITVTASGGTGSLSYVLNEMAANVSGAASGIFTGVGAGTYTVTVTDLNLCQRITLPVTITNPLAITATAAVTSNYNGSHVSCNGSANGRITVTASGGTGTLEYVLLENPANVTGLNTGIFTGLGAGTYTVRVRDDNNCDVITAPVTVTEPAVVTASATVTSDYHGSDISCATASDAVIAVAAGGGTGALTYSIIESPGNLTGMATGIFTGVGAGTYTIRVTDLNGCNIVTPQVIVIAPTPVTATGTVTSNYNGRHISCFGEDDGEITITAAGGTGVLTYVLNQDPANVTGAATGIFTGLVAGTYTVTVSDENGCIRTTPNIVVVNPPVGTATAVVTSNYNGSQISCNGADDAIITVTAAGGTGAKTFELIEDPLNVTGAVTGVFTGLGPGSYTIRVRDANLCENITAAVTVTEPAAVTAIASVTSNYFGSLLTCNGASDGIITVTSNGGTGARTYSLAELPANTTGELSGVFTGLPAGTYTVNVADKNGCLAVAAPVTIIPPPVITLSVNVTTDYNGQDISCFGASDGRALATAGGGTSMYFYAWYSDAAMTIPIGQLTPVAINLAAGDYFVRVMDINGCTISGGVILTQPSAPDATITTQTNVLCYGSTTGSVTVEAVAGTGTAPYQYSINGGSTWHPTGTFNNLAASLYTVLARDLNGCVKMVAVTIIQPAQLTASVTSIANVSCNGAGDGTVTVTATAGSGTAPYRYSINGGTDWFNSGTFTGLVSGTYNISVIDAGNCTIAVPALITEPPLLQLTSTPDVLLDCFDDKDGTGTFFVNGGNPGYIFTVEANTSGATFAVAGFNFQSFFNAGEGSVSVRVTDSKGCSLVEMITFTQPAVLVPGTIESNQVICSGSAPLEITQVNPATGGPGAFNYQWQYSTSATGTFFNVAGANMFQYTPPANATSTLYYRRMVTSGICAPAYSNAVEIKVNPLPIAILSGNATVCPGGSAIIRVSVPSGLPPFELELENHGVITGYTSDADITVTPVVTTIYRLLRVRDANGCEISGASANLIGMATITVRNLPLITTSPVGKTICEYGATSFSVTSTGSDLMYQWYVDKGTGFELLPDGGVYFGSTSPTLNIFGGNRSQNGYVFHVVVTGCSTSVTSGDAILTVNTSPQIMVQPVESTVCSTANTSFSVTANGTGLTYQWQVNTGSGFSPVADGGVYSGATTATLTLTGVPGSYDNYIYRVIVSGTCQSPVYSNFVMLRVTAPPVVTLNPAGKLVCEGAGSVYFTANGSGMVDSLRWQINNGGIWTDIYDNGVYSGTNMQQLSFLNPPASLNGREFRLALKAACTTVYTAGATLAVNSNPVITFAADPVAVCGNVAVTMMPVITGGSGTWTQHTWSGDISPLNTTNIQNPVFRTPASGLYNLDYRIRDNNGCFGTATVAVNVDSPDANFNYTIAAGNNCTPLTVTFTKDMPGISSFEWDFGDGSLVNTTTANPEHVYTNPTPATVQYHTVKLTVYSAGGCMAVKTMDIMVTPAIDATFTANKTVVCSGEPISFSTLPGASNYAWNYGDGTGGTGTNVTNHTYTNSGSTDLPVTIKLTTTSFYGCMDTETLDIVVKPRPIPQFTPSPVRSYYIDGSNPVTFTNETNPGTWTWAWDFGDGSASTEQNPSHTYSAIGTFKVILEVSNGTCSAEITHQVSIDPIPPVADFDSIPSGCEPLMMYLNNTSLHADIPGTTYRWDFGDGGTSVAKNPVYTFFDPGIYRVELTVTGPAGDYSIHSQVVHVYPTPIASFDVAPKLVFVNDEKVRAFNLSQGADYYVWEWGDGDTSKTREPFHKYMESGVYDISLSAYKDNGNGNICYDKYTMSPGVTVEPAGDLRFASVFRPNLTGPEEVTDLPTGERIDQFFFPPIRERVINYKLQIFNRLGTLIFESHDINIPWNGYYKGQLCPQGVYVWFVEGKYSNGQVFKKVGDITLLH